MNSFQRSSVRHPAARCALKSKSSMHARVCFGFENDGSSSPGRGMTLRAQTTSPSHTEPRWFTHGTSVGVCFLPPYLLLCLTFCLCLCLSSCPRLVEEAPRVRDQRRVPAVPSDAEAGRLSSPSEGHGVRGRLRRGL